MAVTVYSSTDESAPVLNGAIGSFIALLDACLINGYGAKAAAGWAKSFSGTNLATYRAPAGNRMYLAVDDTTALYSRVRGFEVATAAGVPVSSGTGPFPTDVQANGGGYFPKSSATGTTRDWIVAADDRCVYVIHLYSTNTHPFFFGDFFSYKAGDAYNTAIIHSSTATDETNPSTTSTEFGGTSNGHFIARSYTQIGGSTAFGVGANAHRGGSGYFGYSGSAYPSPIEGALVLDRAFLQEATAGVRGHLLGLWNPMHKRPLLDGDTFAGTGVLAGKTFIAKSSVGPGQFFLETSNTWYI